MTRPTDYFQFQEYEADAARREERIERWKRCEAPPNEASETDVAESTAPATAEGGPGGVWKERIDGKDTGCGRSIHGPDGY